MIFAILPKANEEELLTKLECTRTFLDIKAWCRQKAQNLRTRELSGFTRRLTGSSSHFKATWSERMAMANDHRIDDQGQGAQGEPLPPLKPLPEESAPACAQKLIAAVRQPGTKPPPKPTGVRPPRPTNTSPRVPRGFKFVGSWHCKDPDHTRSGGRDGNGKKCPKFADILKKANPGIVDRKEMTLPASCLGAYEKALLAA